MKSYIVRWIVEDLGYHSTNDVQSSFCHGLTRTIYCDSHQNLYSARRETGIRVCWNAAQSGGWAGLFAWSYHLTQHRLKFEPTYPPPSLSIAKKPLTRGCTIPPPSKTPLNNVRCGLHLKKKKWKRRERKPKLDISCILITEASSSGWKSGNPGIRRIYVSIIWVYVCVLKRWAKGYIHLRTGDVWQTSERTRAREYTQIEYAGEHIARLSGQGWRGWGPKWFANVQPMLAKRLVTTIHRYLGYINEMSKSYI
jgi:hypothetical protein